MRLREGLNITVTEQKLETDGYVSEVELVFTTSYGEQSQKIMCFQSHEDIQKKLFKLYIREIDDE